MVDDPFSRLLAIADQPEPSGDTHFIYVELPEQLEPDEREVRYGQPLDAELQLAGCGYVSGGGSLFDAPDQEGERAMIYCGVDVDAYDLDAARALLREHLPELGCKPGTRLCFSEADGHWHDSYDGQEWQLRQASPPAEDDQ